MGNHSTPWQFKDNKEAEVVENHDHKHHKEIKITLNPESRKIQRETTPLYFSSSHDNSELKKEAVSYVHQHPKVIKATLNPESFPSRHVISNKIKKLWSDVIVTILKR